MILPHSSRFIWRRTIFWLFCAASLLLAAVKSTLDGRHFALALLASATLSLVLYYYSRWLAGIEARFRSVHPRRFRVINLLMFYGNSAAAMILLALWPWLASWWTTVPLDSAAGYFIAPALMASAAGFSFHGYHGEAVA